MKLRTEFTTATLEIEGATFTITELGTTKLTAIAIVSREGQELSLLETFLATVVSWSNVTDLAGVDLECNEANKRTVFEVNQDLVETILNQSVTAIRIAIEAQKKI